MRTRTWTTAATVTGLCLVLTGVCRAQQGADAGVVRISDTKTTGVQQVECTNGTCTTCPTGECYTGPYYYGDCNACQYPTDEWGCRDLGNMLRHGEAPCPHCRRKLRGTAMMAVHIGTWPVRALVAAGEGRPIEKYGPISTYLGGGTVMSPDYGYARPVN